MAEPINRFSITHQVKVHECDQQDQIKPSALLRLMEEVSSRHLDSLGLPYHLLAERGMVFVLLQVGCRIHRKFGCNQQLVLETTPHPPQGVQFERSNRVYTPTGELLASAYTRWVLINPQTRRPLRPKALDFSLPFLQPIDPDGLRDYQPKIVLDGPAQGNRPLRYSDIDCNRHLNNAVYGDMMMDILPYEVACNRQISQFYLHFLHEARWPAEIALRCHQQSPDCYWVDGASDQPHFTAELRFAPNA